MLYKEILNILKNDFYCYVSKANSGDTRCGYAAIEVYHRLEELGAEQEWLASARKDYPRVTKNQKISVKK